MRQRSVAFNAAAAMPSLITPGVLSAVAAEAEASGDRTIVPSSSPVTMRLFDGREVTFEPMELAVRVPRDIVEIAGRHSPVVEWIGVTRDTEGVSGVASLTFSPDAGGYGVAGAVELPGSNRIVVSSGGADTAMLSETAAVGAPPFRDAVRTVATSALSTSDNAEAVADVAAAATSSPRIDVIVAYGNGNPSDIVSRIGAGITEMNAALSVSGSATRMNLISTPKVSYTQDPANMAKDLDALAAGVPPFDSLHTKRDSLLADLVALVVPNGSNYAGIADVPPPGGAADAAWAVMANGYFGGDSHVVAHELGHTLGCSHNPEVFPNPYPFPYSHGKAVPGVARDIMSYTDSCASSCPPAACPVTLQYSNPSVAFIGHAGVSSGDTTQRNNVRSIGDIAPYVAAYRNNVPHQALHGDFDGDGIGDVFWYRPGVYADYVWYGTSARGGFQQFPETLNGTYLPFVGDFDGDGRSDILWYGSGTTADHIWYGNATRGSFTKIDKAVNAPYAPLVADFDGDGRSDIFWYRAGTGTDHLWYGTSTRGTFDSYTETVDGTYTPIVGDFDGDGRSDVFWYAAGSTADSIWYADAQRGSFTPVAKAVAGTYTPLVGDFDGDGHSDVFWYGPGSAGDHVWYGEARGSFTQLTMSVAGTYTPLVGDFDADGRSDIFWYKPGTSADDLWYGEPVRGSFTSFPQTVNGSYNATPVADYDGDGHSDIFWYAQGPTQDVVWYASATRGSFASTHVSVPDWR